MTLTFDRQVTLKILVADKNKRVGEFLKRELERDSHAVYLADTGSGVMDQINKGSGFDLLIIDPDLPDMESPILFQSLNDRLPRIGTILHTFLGDNSWDIKNLSVVAKVEKRANSIDSIRKAVMQFARKTD